MTRHIFISLLVLLSGFIICLACVVQVKAAELDDSNGLVIDSLWLFRLKTVHKEAAGSPRIVYQNWPLGRELNHDTARLFERSISYDRLHETSYRGSRYFSKPDQLVVIQANLPEFFGTQPQPVAIPLCFELDDRPFQTNPLSQTSPDPLQCQPVFFPGSNQQSSGHILCQAYIQQSSQRISIAVTGGKLNPHCSAGSSRFEGPYGLSGFYYLATYSADDNRLETAESSRQDAPVSFDSTEAPEPFTAPEKNYTAPGYGGQEDFQDKKRPPFFIEMPELKLAIILPGLYFPGGHSEYEISEDIDWHVDTSQTHIILHFVLGDIHESLSLSLEQWTLLVEHNVHQSRNFLFLLMRKLTRGKMRREALSEELRVWLDYQESGEPETVSDEEKQRTADIIDSVLQEFQSLPFEERSVEAVLAGHYEHYLEQQTGWEADRAGLAPKQYLDALMLVMERLSRRDLAARELRQLWGGFHRLLIEPPGRLAPGQLQALLTEQNQALLREILRLILDRISGDGSHTHKSQVNTPAASNSSLPGYNMPRDIPEEKTSSALASGRGTSRGTQKRAIPTASGARTGIGSNDDSRDIDTAAQPPAGADRPHQKQKQALVPTGREAFWQWMHRSPLGTDYYRDLQGRLLSGELSEQQIPWFAAISGSPSVVKFHDLLDRLLTILNTGVHETDLKNSCSDWLREMESLLNDQLASFDNSRAYYWIEQHTGDQGPDQELSRFITQMHCRFSQQNDCSNMPEWFFSLMEERYFSSLLNPDNLLLARWQSCDSCNAGENQETTLPDCTAQKCITDPWHICQFVFPENTDEVQTHIVPLDLVPIFSAIELDCLIYLSLADPGYELPGLPPGKAGKRVTVLHTYSPVRHYTYDDFCTLILRLFTYTAYRYHKFDKLVEYLHKFLRNSGRVVSYSGLINYFQALLENVQAELPVCKSASQLLGPDLEQLDLLALYTNLPPALSTELVRVNEWIVDKLLSSGQLFDAYPLLLFLGVYSENTREVNIRLACEALMQTSEPCHRDMPGLFKNAPRGMLLLLQEITFQMLDTGWKPESPVLAELTLFLKQQKKMMGNVHVWDSSVQLEGWGRLIPIHMYPSDTRVIWHTDPVCLVFFMMDAPHMTLYLLSEFQQEMRTLAAVKDEVSFIHSDDPEILVALINQARLMMFYNRVAIKYERILGFFYHLFQKLGILPQKDLAPPKYMNKLMEIQRNYIDVIVSTLANDRSQALNKLDAFYRDIECQISVESSDNIKAKIHKFDLLKCTKQTFNKYQAQTEAFKGAANQKLRGKKFKADDKARAGVEEGGSRQKDWKAYVFDSHKYLADHKSFVMEMLPEATLEDHDALKWAVHSIYFPFDTGRESQIIKELTVMPNDDNFANFYHAILRLRNGDYKQALSLLDAAVKEAGLTQYLKGMIHLSGRVNAPDRETAKQLFREGFEIMRFGPALAQLIMLDPGGADIEDLSGSGYLADEEARLLIAWNSSPSPENLASLKQRFMNSKNPRVHFRLVYLSSQQGEIDETYCHGVHTFFKLLTPQTALFFIADPFRDTFVAHVDQCLRQAPVKADLAHVFVILEKLPWIAPEQKERRLKQRGLTLARELNRMLPKDMDSRLSLMTFFKGKSATVLSAYIKLAVQASRCPGDSDACLARLLVQELQRKEPNIRRIKRLMTLDELCSHCLVANISEQDRISAFEHLESFPSARDVLTSFYGAVKTLAAQGQLSVTANFAYAITIYLQKNRPDNQDEHDFWLNSRDRSNDQITDFYHRLLMKGLRENADEAWLSMLMNKVSRLNVGRASLQPLTDHLARYFLVQLDIQDNPRVLQILRLIEQSGINMFSGDQLRYISDVLLDQAHGGITRDWAESVYNWTSEHWQDLGRDSFLAVATRLTHYARIKWPGKITRADSWLDRAEQHPQVEACELTELLINDFSAGRKHDAPWLKALYQRHLSYCQEPGHTTGLLVAHILRGINDSTGSVDAGHLLSLYPVLNPQHPEQLWLPLLREGKISALVHCLVRKKSAGNVLAAIIGPEMPGEVFHELWESLLALQKPDTGLLVHLLSLPALKTERYQRDLLYLTQVSIEDGWSVKITDLLVSAMEGRTLKKIKDASLLYLLEQVQRTDNREALFSALFAEHPEKLKQLNLEKNISVIIALLGGEQFTYRQLVELLQVMPSVPVNVQACLYPAMLGWVESKWLPSLDNADKKLAMTQWFALLKTYPKVSIRTYTHFFSVLMPEVTTQEKDRLTSKLVFDSIKRFSSAMPVVQLLQAIYYLGQRLSASVLGAVIDKCQTMLKEDQPAIEPLELCFFWSMRLARPADMMDVFDKLTDSVHLLVWRESFSGSFAQALANDLKTAKTILEQEQAASDIDHDRLWDHLYWSSRLGHWYSLVETSNDEQTRMVDELLQAFRYSLQALILKSLATRKNHPFAMKIKPSTLYLYYRNPKVRSHMSPGQLAAIQEKVQEPEKIESLWSSLVQSIEALHGKQDLRKIEALVASSGFQAPPEELKGEWQDKVREAFDSRLYDVDTTPKEAELLYKLGQNPLIMKYLPAATIHMLQEHQLRHYFRFLEHLTEKEISETTPIKMFAKFEDVVSRHLPTTEDPHIQHNGAGLLTLSKLLRLRVLQLTGQSVHSLVQNILKAGLSVPDKIPEANRHHIAEAIVTLSECATENIPRKSSHIPWGPGLVDALTMLMARAESYETRLQMRVYEQLAILHQPGILPEAVRGKGADFFWRQALILGSVKACRALGLQDAILHKLKKLRSAVRLFNENKFQRQHYPLLAEAATQVIKAERLDEYPNARRILEDWYSIEALFQQGNDSGPPQRQ